MKEILEEDLASLEKDSPNDYDKASWAYSQADKNGEKRRLKQVLELLSFLP